MQRQPHWRSKFNEIVQVCTDELKKTTEIGKKMLNASKTNSSLHEAYEELGVLVAKAIEKKQLDWDNPRALELISKIKRCQTNLHDIETEVNKIKFAPGPVDISKNHNSKEHPKDQ
ncbi:MAG: hypothetical protein COW01_10045 [Bdellovibrionales bacterium CG12_big_fil_rev_8_21_14_0_65_38_15]|nr:MAG: hypothetical protein COW79_06890 [Bdellovibrionales bacterium CG22_combo_CG10-13_8_21_14_all_38_13]PIQ54478.1 MAG: hypothetical protein COW01_10045 [Bdellovibrionales bacterium CG12_big_fil_rev_8_21_14_0_65_38_15]PIR29859.1 MAG: hypothetical protein COV38_07890 [Bdellovibrionales bacterium CG11_big_fil_rev_8_21_14_0_20_38_13]